MSEAALTARLAELELRYMELQHDFDSLSEVVRELDHRLDRAESALASLQSFEDPFED